MANVEDRDLEDILVETEAPRRVKSEKNKKPRIAKLTSRTIASLKEKIRENRLNKAYAKYNKKYRKMQKAAEVADTLRKEKENGVDITNSELALEYSIVASYDKKLAKMGAKLLKEDIKKAVAQMDVSSKVSVGKRIKVPRFLLTKMQKLVRAIEKTKVKKEEKKLVKEMTKQTKEYIKNSLDGAVFKEDGSIQAKIDSEVIRNLGLKGGKNEPERRLDTLKSFISLDGEKPYTVPPTDEGKDFSEIIRENEEEIDASKFAEVFKNKGAKSVDETTDLEKKDDSTKHEKWNKIFKEIDEGLEEDYKDTKTEDDKPTKKVEEPVKEKNDTDRQQEVESILKCNDKIRQLKDALKNTKDPDVRAVLTKAIENEKEKMNEIVKDKKIEDKKEESTKTSTEEMVEDKKITVEEKEKTDKTASGAMENVTVKTSEEKRTVQTSEPTKFKVTLADIKKLEEREKAAITENAQLKAENEGIKKEIDILKDYLEQAKRTQQAQNELNATRQIVESSQDEYARLNAEASEIAGSLRK